MTSHQFTLHESNLACSIPTFGKPADIALGVKALSDLYIKKRPQLSKIWEDERLAHAYLSYFLPLNIFRLSYVLNQGQTLGFFDKLEHFIDFGSGPGSADLVFSDASLNFTTSTFIEVGRLAVIWHKKLLTNLKLPTQNKYWLNTTPKIIPKNSLISFSYALNELTSLPAWALEAEALMILEPSTQIDGRKLQQLRKDLLKLGYFIWAPCTHQENCPLLELSKTDWCHQRIHIELSKNLAEIEKHLPIKNQTLTFSYLLARRTPPPKTKLIRIIGDTQYERGKIKQAACRGAKREFLTWLTRYGEPPILERGSLLDLPAGTEEKGNEIRLPIHNPKK